MKNVEVFSNENNLNKNKCLLKFFILFFVKSKLGPIIGITMPLIFMLFYYIVAQNKGTSTIFINGIPSFISLSILPLALISIPQMMVELKNSIILRRIKNAGFTKLWFVSLIFLFYFVAIWIFSIIALLIFLAIINKDIVILEYINFGNLFYSVTILIFCSIIIGIFLGSIIKNLSLSFLIGVSLFLVTLIFAGQFIPLNVIGNVDALKYLSLFSPLNYAASLINNVVYSPGNDLNGNPMFDPGQNIFDINSILFISSNGSVEDPSTILYDKWQKILNLIMPYVVSPIFILLSNKFFNWYGR